jgi:hypothetical protein
MDFLMFLLAVLAGLAAWIIAERLRKRERDFFHKHEMERK